MPNTAKKHQSSFGERVTDAIASFMGSWRFIIGQTIGLLAWMALNILAVIQHWNNYPLVILNLLFFAQLAYAAPIIMLAQNRQIALDRKRENMGGEKLDDQLKSSQQQLQIISQQVEILDLLHAQQSRGDTLTQDVTTALHDLLTRVEEIQQATSPTADRLQALDEKVDALQQTTTPAAMTEAVVKTVGRRTRANSSSK